MSIPAGEAAARYAKEHQVSLAAAAKRFGVSRERARQKWREIFGTEPTPTRTAQVHRDKTITTLATQGLSASEIAAELNLHPNSVSSVCKRLHIDMVTSREKNAVTAETKRRIVELARAGKSRAQITKEAGVGYGAVTKYLVGSTTRGIRTPSGVCAFASEIMDATGCSLPEAAAKFSVSPPALYAYRKRRGLWTTRCGIDQEIAPNANTNGD